MFKRVFSLKHLMQCMAVVLILKFNYYECSNANQRFYTNTTSTNLFRFRDFEPRYTMKTDAEILPKMFNGLVSNTRKSRGFQFHADERDVTIDMEFIIPFVRIPVKRSMSATQTAFRNLLNLNFQSLLTTGGIAAIGGIFAIILKGLFSTFVYMSDYKKNSRHHDADEASTIFNPLVYTGNATKSIPNVNQFPAILDSKLHEHNINVRRCIQKSICKYAQKAFWDNTLGNDAGGYQKMFNGVISLDLVRNYLSGTAIQHALDSANNKEKDCDHIYQDCNWSFSTKKILKYLSKNFNYFNIK